MTVQVREPRYATVARTLIAEIAAGQPPVGAMLAPELVLCKRFGVSRITMRRALGELQARGLVSRRAGAGTRVESPSARGPFVHDGSSIDEVLAFTAGMTFRVLSRRTGVARPNVAAQLGCACGAPIVTFVGLRLVPGAAPICVSRHVLPRSVADVLGDIDGTVGSLARRIEIATGDTIVEIRQRIEAALIARTDAARLGVEAGEPALTTSRVYIGASGAAVLASESSFPRARYAYASTLRRAPSDRALVRSLA